jgi:hypothetical protein
VRVALEGDVMTKTARVLICAWVLWGIPYFPLKDAPYVIDAGETKEECESAARPQRDVLRKSSISFVCLPDTVDPRRAR